MDLPNISNLKDMSIDQIMKIQADLQSSNSVTNQSNKDRLKSMIANSSKARSKAVSDSGSNIDSTSNSSKVEYMPKNQYVPKDDSKTLDISNFTIEDLLKLFKINESIDDLTLSVVQKKTDTFLNKISNKSSNKNLRKKIIDSQKKLIAFFTEKDEMNNLFNYNSDDEDDEDDENNKNNEDDDEENYNQSLIITRKTTDKDTEYIKPVKQGQMNPNLKNTTTHSLIIDSRFRQFSYSPKNIQELNTNPFMIDLDDPISDLISFKLYSVQIPLVWNNISYTKKNNVFFISVYDITDLTVNETPPTDYLKRDINGKLVLNTAAELVCRNKYIPVTIPSNSYETIESIIEVINNSIDESIELYKKEIFPICKAVADTENNSEENNSGDNSNNVTMSNDIDIDIKFKYNPVNNMVNLVIKKGSIRFFSIHNDSKFDFTLGWLLGFRHLTYDTNITLAKEYNKEYLFNEEENTITYEAEALYDITDTKFVMIYIDDFLQNRINTNVQSSGDTATAIQTRPIPSNTDNPTAIDSTLVDDYVSILGEKPTNVSNDLLVLPTKPRNYTRAELFSFSKTYSSTNTPNNTIKNARISPPLTNNAFAVIPLKGTSPNLKDKNRYPYVDFSGSLQTHSRNYFGPVDLKRLKVSIVDDKGQLLDFKGIDWSFVILYEKLYQY
tara:strand:+ start:18558 stop:20564 length:2007 start_codon:yes stop_codon:yes gene_type:complete